MEAGFGKVQDAVSALVRYGLETGLIEQEDAVFAANSIFSLLCADPSGEYDAAPSCGPVDFTDGQQTAGANAPAAEEAQLEQILQVLLDYAVEQGVIEEGITSRDLFDTKIMGCLTPRPSEVIRRFTENYRVSPNAATDYFYKLSQDCDYIRRYRIKKDRKWIAPTRYGDLDITINLSKPEKDPKAIAAALTKKQGDTYPKCLLCCQNVGYAGRMDHPARQNIRLIPLSLADEQWFMQYSPYVYYNEHCIVLSGEHRPMKIERKTFRRLLQFLQKFPHYTIGSNADLPIVGGSILTHEHYQGGRYTFAMAKAPCRERITFRAFPEIEAGIVDWPMSVIRLDGTDPDRLVELADRILSAWRGYTDETADVLAFSDGEPHNTITPIARMRGEKFELDLVLRNNRTTQEYPLGIFHPHQELHHIKKENIGLIEVMGLAVLPARLLGEMDVLAREIMAGNDLRQNEQTAPHADWADSFLRKYPAYSAAELEKVTDPAARAALREELDRIIEKEIGLVFAQVLEHCAVFADTEKGHVQFEQFIRTV
ncbi:MAG: UDP-glucose--hexose-1-phosphate uridylyltransferase [Eubacteriales bacterium]|nr:UDP-glucose--hexose-1-phosphate uridylyltransferase [Eubacteriales bacterium]